MMIAIMGRRYQQSTIIKNHSDNNNNNDAYYDADDGEEENEEADKEEEEIGTAPSVSNAFVSFFGDDNNYDDKSRILDLLTTDLQSVILLFLEDRSSPIMPE